MYVHVKLLLSLLICTLVICETINNIETETSLQGKSVVKRFIADTFKGAFHTMVEGMFVMGGWIPVAAFAKGVQGQCTVCKCFNECKLDREQEAQICEQFWDDTDCTGATTVSPSSMTTPEHVTIAPLNGGPAKTIPTCDKFITIGSVAKKVILSNPNGTKCDDPGSYASPKSFTSVCCPQLDDVASSWIQGPKVMDDCPGLPNYIPVGKFNRLGALIEGSTGVFVACLEEDETGFQLIHQDCEAAPDIVHVSDPQGPQNYRDPENYFVILS